MVSDDSRRVKRQLRPGFLRRAARGRIRGCANAFHRRAGWTSCARGDASCLRDLVHLDPTEALVLPVLQLRLPRAAGEEEAGAVGVEQDLGEAVFRVDAEGQPAARLVEEAGIP